MRPGAKARLDLIRLATPTTDDERLPAVLEGASGFVYYVSLTGVTGTKRRRDHVRKWRCAVARDQAPHRSAGRRRLRRQNGGDAAAIAKVADAVVVGSALVDAVARALDAGGKANRRARCAVTGAVARTWRAAFARRAGARESSA